MCLTQLKYKNSIHLSISFTFEFHLKLLFKIKEIRSRVENKYWNNSIVVIIIYITFIKQKNEKTWKCFLMGIHNVYMLEFAENYIVGSFSFFTLSIGKFVHSKNQQLAHSEFFNMEFEPSRYFFFIYSFQFCFLTL